MSKRETLVEPKAEILDTSITTTTEITTPSDLDHPHSTTDVATEGDDVIIITIPTGNNICIEDAVEEVETVEIVRQDMLLSPLSQSSDSDCVSNYDSSSESLALYDSVSLHSPSSSIDNDMMDSDVGYESLDSPPNENLRLLFPEIL